MGELAGINMIICYSNCVAIVCILYDVLLQKLSHFTI